MLDKIRGSAVTKLEPGQISQHIGASYIPISVIKKICGPLLEKLKVKITIPALLIIDTPGHESFTTLRRRGGAVADIAILVIDINEGFQPQTDESLTFLKEFKTPFVVAATKTDRIPGWFPHADSSFLESFQRQRNDVRDDLEKKIYRLVSQLAERGYEAERFDRVEDFRKRVAIVPTSGITGEGVPELLMVLTGLAQQFLKKQLEVSEIARGTILEVKETVGLGTTVDVILYDGMARVGDYMVVGGKKPVVTKARALLRPPALRELRVEKKFERVREVSAAAGIKVAGIGLEDVIAGSPVVFVSNEEDVEEAKNLVQKEVEEVEFVKDVEGIVLKADTLGGLEAMIKMLTEEGVPIRKAEVGHVTKQDVNELQSVKDDLRKAVLAFNVKVLEDAKSLSEDLRIKIFKANIIYKLIEDYKEWCLQKRERELQEKLAKVARPVKLKILEGCIFHAAKPCIVGVEVLAGYLKSGIRLKRKDGKVVGKVKEMQREGKSIKEAKTRDKVAISMDEPIAGRTINEGDVLTTALTESDKKILREVWDRLTEDERELLKEI